MGAEDRGRLPLSLEEVQRILGTLSAEQEAAVRVLLNQEQVIRQRLEQVIVQMQQGRGGLSAAEQDAADQEAEARRSEMEINRRRAANGVRPYPNEAADDRQYVAARQEFIQNRAHVAQQALPAAPAGPDPAQFAQSMLMNAVEQLTQRMSAIEVALAAGGRHMPTPVTAQPAHPVSPAPFGYATPNGATPLYNPSMNGGYAWRR